MKKNFFPITLSAIFTIYYLMFTIAATAAPAPTTTNPQNIKNQLIETIASRVAELKLVEKRGIIGVVTEVSNTQIAITDIQNNTRFVDVDELTKFSSPLTKGSFGISDISKGTTLGVLGLYNKESRRLLARFVNVITLPKFIHGSTSEIDSRNYTLSINTEDGKNITIDINNSVRILSYTKDKLTRSSFSKIEKDESVIVIGFSNIKDKDRIITERIILFPDLLKIPKLTPFSSESTRSGQKLMPITR